MKKMALMMAVLGLMLLSADRPVAADDPVPPPFDFKQLDPILGQGGTLKDEVYTVTVPRTDFALSVDGMEVPTAAGLCSQFYFFHCSCGKTRVVGQFCCCDYEMNDVIDALRAGSIIEVAGTGPMFVTDKPRLMLIRFQGEGDATALARLVRSGLNWTGDARNNQPTTAPAGH